MGGADSGLWGQERGQWNILDDLLIQRGSQTPPAARCRGGYWKSNERHWDRGITTRRKSMKRATDESHGWGAQREVPMVGREAGGSHCDTRRLFVPLIHASRIRSKRGTPNGLARDANSGGFENFRTSTSYMPAMPQITGEPAWRHPTRCKKLFVRTAVLKWSASCQLRNAGAWCASLRQMFEWFSFSSPRPDAASGTSSVIGYSLSWTRATDHSPITTPAFLLVCFPAFEACASELFRHSSSSCSVGLLSLSSTTLSGLVGQMPVELMAVPR